MLLLGLSGWNDAVERGRCMYGPLMGDAGGCNHGGGWRGLHGRRRTAGWRGLQGTPPHHHQKREATRSIQKIDMPQLIHPLILLTLLARLLVMYVMISPTMVSDHPTTSPATRMRPLGLAAEWIPEPVRWSLFLPS